MTRLAWYASFALALGSACHAGGGVNDTSAGSADSSAASDTGSTPVTMSVVTLRTLEQTVSGPGETDVAEDERVRAPFTGVLTAVTVNVGDVVPAGGSVGAIVAENSDAALRGARSMVSAARTPAERRDAERALQVARANVVVTPLRVSKAGVVIARAASTGERVVQGDSLVSLAATGQMVFFADVSQQDLAAVHPGERARITLTARDGWIPASVHGVVPSDTGSTAAMRVRLDLQPPSTPVTVGLFGTADIVVNQHVNVPVVPKSALLRDDVTGVTQIALVGADNRARWTRVTTGLVDSAWAEILMPRLAAGQRVITTGQVGLPDSSRVVAVSADTGAGAATAGGTGATSSSNGRAGGNGRGGIPGSGSQAGAQPSGAKPNTRAPGANGGANASPANPSTTGSPASAAGSAPQPGTGPGAASSARSPATKPAGRGGKPPGGRG
ncbi:MAG TPA: HlyD family efflux transporter periplasmic adaptor subunit [Gemmatimonadaceae bacterium]|nr:HlyD family efflux transporter periplasmic adaptor subunit [Gemmatimonadaceae bacterium]